MIDISKVLHAGEQARIMSSKLEDKIDAHECLATRCRQESINRIERHLRILTRDIERLTEMMDEGRELTRSLDRVA